MNNTTEENQNSNSKNSRVGNFENTFQSKVEPVKPGKVPYYRKRRFQKKNDLDKYVIFCIVIMLIYTVVDKVTFIMTGGMESSTLTVAFFGVFGGEIFLCAMIKRLKLHKEIKEKNDNGIE